MKRYPYFTPSNYDEFLEDVKKHLSRDEPGVIIAYQRSGIAWRSEQLVQDYADRFDAPIHLISFSEKTETAELLKSIEQSRYVIVQNTEFAFQNGTAYQINELIEHQRVRRDDLNILFFSEIDIFEPTYKKLITQYTFFADISYYPLYTKDASLDFLNHMCKRWELSLSREQKQKIVRNCLGSVWLIKHALRLVMSAPDENIDVLIEDPSMQFRVEAIWDSFTKGEQEDLLKIHQHSSTKGISLLNLQYFEQIGLVKKDRITIPLLDRHIGKHTEKQHIEVIQNEILINSVPVTGIFSDQEREVVLLLLSHAGDVVDRETIAQVLWKSETDEKYSPWAIEQLIKRLRKKLVSLDMPRDCIKTVRGKGYVFIIKLE